MTFGALLPCTVCKGGQLVFDKYGYICNGDLTEWTKCNNLVKEPPRKAFVIPDELKSHSFLKKYKYVARTRVVKQAPPKLKKKERDEDNDQYVLFNY